MKKNKEKKKQVPDNRFTAHLWTIG